MKGRDPDWAQRDLVTALRTGDYPKWKMQIQVMSDYQCGSFRWNPFDPTKIWPKRDFPLMDVGTLTLKELPENYFAEVEQAAFSPSNVVDGISFSPDRLLQGRILAYPDAQRHRLGANYEQIPVNRPVCPVHNHERDGAMSVTGNGGALPNYSPNSFNGHTGDKHMKEPALLLDSNQMDTFNRNENDTDHYSQPRWLYHTVMTPKEQTSLITNLIESMRNIGSSKREEIIVRQLNHFYLIDNEMAMRIAEGLSLRFVPS
jgi:catalase